jgi:predicted metal-dependent hydrolase
MIGWLRDEMQSPQVTLCGRTLPLAIRRHPRAQRLTMRLAPDGSEIRITLPRWGRTLDAVTFVNSRLDWLEGQLAKVPERAPPSTDGHVLYRGELVPIAWAKSRPRRPQFAEGRLALGGPPETLPQRIHRWLENEALDLFASDLAHYCALAGKEMPDLKLSRAQRRWGSCSGKGSIRINWRLVQAPDLVRRSVVAHEVVHLVHFDHSPAFHALLRDIYEGDLKQADAWLRREGRKLYSAFG